MGESTADRALSVYLAGRNDLRVDRIPVPHVGPGARRIRMAACGICGSDLRYLRGENPWSSHTLGRDRASRPNMVLGHEVSGVLMRESADGLQEEARVAVLAYKACGTCAACLAGRENICADVQHIGHDTGWPEMDHYPGGMAEEFEVWEDFAYQIPDSISFDEATFLDGLAVAIHACDRAKVSAGSRVAVIGLGPIGMMAAQVARDRGASHVTACDTDPLPIRLARDLGLEDALREDALRFLSQRGELDAVIDTVGNSATIEPSLRALRPGGALALLALHSGALTLDSLSLSGERLITTSANNRYADFPHAIELLTERRVRVDSLVTHRFPLSRAVEAFEVMADKEAAGAYKIILHP